MSSEIKDGSNVLELGCGPGHLSEKILINMPNTRIVCIEGEKKFVKMAKTRLSTFIESGRLQVVQGDSKTSMLTTLS